MFRNKPTAVLLVYGRGGHAAQMKRFLNSPEVSNDSQTYVTLSNENITYKYIVDSYFCIDARDKYHWYKNIFITLAYVFIAFFQIIRIFFKYKIVGMISTGPGLAIIPGVFCRVFGKKVVFFEDWCRFSTPSIAGRVMYRLANVFFIQYEYVKRFYPNSIYKGRL